MVNLYIKLSLICLLLSLVTFVKPDNTDNKFTLKCGTWKTLTIVILLNSSFTLVLKYAVSLTKYFN